MTLTQAIVVDLCAFLVTVYVIINCGIAICYAIDLDGRPTKFYRWIVLFLFGAPLIAFFLLFVGKKRS